MTRLVSYAQNFEDIILWRALSHVPDGRYVDIGAQSPDIDSVSRLFHQRGWKGVHVEPTPAYAEKLRSSRPGDVVLQCAISAQPGALRFFEIQETGLSTMDEHIARAHADDGFVVTETSVVAITLDSLLEHVGSGPIHWLKIDVEGAERLVLQGWVSSPMRPWIVVVESTLPLSTEQTHEAWEPLLLAKGYQFAYFDGLNRFYLSDEHRELAPAFQCGPNVFDNFSLSSSSMFCAEVNIAYHELELRAEAREAEFRVDIESQQRLYASQVDALKASAADDLEAQRAAHAAEIARREILIEEARAHSETLLVQIEGLSAQISGLQEQVAQVAEENVLIRHTLRRRIEQARQNAREELELAYKRIDDLAHEAHRWWVNAENLRSQLQVIEGSHSWRLTAPLRALRRKSARASTESGRAGRRLLRPLLVGSMRRVLDTPLLRSSVKPLLARFPIVNSRLIALASTEGLLNEGTRRNEILGGRERVVSPVHLDARARSVLSDINRAMDGDGN
jgi:FkbM family methyltransferase